MLGLYFLHLSILNVTLFSFCTKNCLWQVYWYSSCLVSCQFCLHTQWIFSSYSPNLLLENVLVWVIMGWYLKYTVCFLPIFKRYLLSWHFSWILVLSICTFSSSETCIIHRFRLGFLLPMFNIKLFLFSRFFLSFHFFFTINIFPFHLIFLLRH